MQLCSVNASREQRMFIEVAYPLFHLSNELKQEGFLVTKVISFCV